MGEQRVLLSHNFTNDARAQVVGYRVIGNGRQIAMYDSDLGGWLLALMAKKFHYEFLSLSPRSGSI